MILRFIPNIPQLFPSHTGAFVHLYDYHPHTHVTHQLNGAEAITQVSVITAVTTELGSVDVSIAVQIITRPDVIAIAATNPDVCADYA